MQRDGWTDSGLFQGLTLRRFAQVRLGVHALGLGVLIVCVLFGVYFPPWVTVLLVLLAVTSNLVFRLPLFSKSNVLAARLVFISLLLDIVIFTVVLILSGGASNPFSVLYLIDVTLAALVLTTIEIWSVVVAAILGYGLLFYFLPTAEHHGGDFGIHLRGMWFAFAFSAIIIAASVSSLTRALREERSQQAETRRLLGLTALAAGAAHELGNPLGTIKLAAGELSEDIKNISEFDKSDICKSCKDDVDTILLEIERATSVLDRLRLAAGELSSERNRSFSLGHLGENLFKELGPTQTRVRLDISEPDKCVHMPLYSTIQALMQLIRNGLDASSSQSEVVVRMDVNVHTFLVEITDRGRGMRAEVLAQFSEPFFTTKQLGQGLGLGAFLAKTYISQLSGSWSVKSEENLGTQILIKFPRSV